jgi:hypothetical protein
MFLSSAEVSRSSVRLALLNVNMMTSKRRDIAAAGQPELPAQDSSAKKVHHFLHLGIRQPHITTEIRDKLSGPPENGPDVFG